MEFMEVLGRRCSIRSYKPDPVEEEKILAIAEAGRLAPTAKNDQNWYCIAVKDDTLRHDPATKPVPTSRWSARHL